MLKIKLLILSLNILLLSCGFKPVYKKDLASDNKLSNIEVTEISSRCCQELRSKLREKLEYKKDINKKYLLIVKADDTSNSRLLLSGNRKAHNSMAVDVNYSLINKNNNDVIYTNEFTIEQDFNDERAYYNLMNKEIVASHILDKIAVRVRDQLIMFFNENKKSTNK